MGILHVTAQYWRGHSRADGEELANAVYHHSKEGQIELSRKVRGVRVKVAVGFRQDVTVVAVEAGTL